MGCSPSNGKSTVVTPTTAKNGTISTAPFRHCRSSRYAAPATTRNSPATGLAIVASAPATSAVTERWTYRQATSPTATPSAKVVRPEATLHHRASAARTAGTRACGTSLRTKRSAISQVPAIPAATDTARTPKKAIKYEEKTL